jgi:hypothetical protein
MTKEEMKEFYNGYKELCNKYKMYIAWDDCDEEYYVVVGAGEVEVGEHLKELEGSVEWAEDDYSPIGLLSVVHEGDVP